jgi:hypothetical protein
VRINNTTRNQLSTIVVGAKKPTMYATTPTNVNINLNEIFKAFLRVTILVKYNKIKVRPITILFKQELTTE